MAGYYQQVESVIEHAKEQGWQVQRTTGNHVQLLSPDGRGIVTTSHRCSDAHSFGNFVAAMKQNGYKPRNDREEQMVRRHKHTIRMRLREAAKANPDLILTPWEFALKLGRDRSSVNHELTALYDQGFLTKVAPGQYKLSRSELYVPPRDSSPSPAPAPAATSADGKPDVVVTSGAPPAPVGGVSELTAALQEVDQALHTLKCVRVRIIQLLSERGEA